jgi:hypothetical protein
VCAPQFGSGGMNDGVGASIRRRRLGKWGTQLGFGSIEAETTGDMVPDCATKGALGWFPYPDLWCSLSGARGSGGCARRPIGRGGGGGFAERSCPFKYIYYIRNLGLPISLCS